MMTRKQRYYYEIENEIKEMLCKKRIDEKNRTEFLFLLKLLKEQGQEITKEWLLLLLKEKVMTKRARYNRINRLLKKLNLKTEIIAKQKKEMVWKKWQGEIKDYTRDSKGNVECLAKPQGFGRQETLISVELFNKIII